MLKLYDTSIQLATNIFGAKGDYIRQKGLPNQAQTEAMFENIDKFIFGGTYDHPF